LEKIYIMLEIINFPETDRVITHCKDDVYYICVFSDKDLTDKQIINRFPYCEFEERFAQLFGTKEELEDIIKNSKHHRETNIEKDSFFKDGSMLISGSIIRLISNRPFYKYEDGENQYEEYSDQGLFFKFIVYA